MENNDEWYVEIGDFYDVTDLVQGHEARAYDLKPYYKDWLQEHCWKNWCWETNSRIDADDLAKCYVKIVFFDPKQAMYFRLLFGV